MSLLKGLKAVVIVGGAIMVEWFGDVSLVAIDAAIKWFTIPGRFKSRFAEEGGSTSSQSELI
ncbi:MAG: hypothetical protein B6D70_03515 [gamma proteobacterium symbiont of Stewartia floridana]|nr:MAG: hypothetical protein B6D76_14830 [gamma proteobacterium symbiont of Stewartia floridana]RLW53281.1 MAG: hypothetical protein B6D69_06145 [gamma proteobacterium symbiont of Stewartia floridana]RLW60520.1 MAG: hypothetical protein B6D75_05605 [gamma proteobacterium symbiont of Stewartia floridana]RLW62914.1 MAG: hypothetical protein B6D73_17365 [gamma proteobacterium symbiont of Stewartia floridana]RLW66547.1 MAG: hypothetical protein B6D70_03515 [gamma proteobacterium symbiont of Stewart